ncbi:hypothetical protein FQA39_LY02443 [Lamprigera yunnana]|nr:hypothetical protein FQA39_LY02443 [Lamprigera yunnana]
MAFPQLYEGIGDQSLRDLNEIYKKYFQLLEVKEYCNIMDVGCGPGKLTRKGLYPILPETLNKLIAVDISSEMIKYAKETYEANSKILFFQMDILTDNIPNDFENHFDHIFSSYCMHLFANQRKALLNIHKMLKSGGKIFLLFPSKCNFIEIYKYMAAKDKWKNLQSMISQTSCSDNPTIYFENLLQEVGFVPRLCFETEKMLEYSKDSFLALAQSRSVFGIPDSLREEFLSEHMEYLKQNNLIRTNGNEVTIHHSYSLLTVFAEKP